MHILYAWCVESVANVGRQGETSERDVNDVKGAEWGGGIHISRRF